MSGVDGVDEGIIKLAKKVIDKTNAKIDKKELIEIIKEVDASSRPSSASSPPS